MKYLCALLLFGLNGIVASNIALGSYEIVFLRTMIGCYLYFSPLAKLPVQTVAICGYLEPLSAVVFAALLLGEEMTALQIVGAVCIIGGAMVGELVKE